MEQTTDEIKEYLELRGFKLVLLTSKNGDKIIDYLTENNVDILLTDKNLGVKTGNDIVKEVRQKNFLTDILLYSAASINDGDYVDLGTNYISVNILPNRLILPTVKKMITKNLLKWEDVVLLRGLIISNTIELETKVDEFFARYFDISPYALSHFDLILEGTVASLNGKKVALKEIISARPDLKNYESIVNDLGHVQESRNVLAHCRSHPSLKNCFISKGGQKTFDKSTMKRILRRVDSASETLDGLISTLMAPA